MTDAERHLRHAIKLARENLARGGRPFGAVVVLDGAVVAEGVNDILATNDPTAHAELNALRAAGKALGRPRLDGASVYASGHPCPMCLAAMRMAGVDEIAYAYSNEDGAAYGLSTAAVYAELGRPLAEQARPMIYVPVRPEGELDLYDAWRAASAD
ncbi:nucleoside deaminase [Caulobacter mirabilis]|uniref:tRNA-specific adenosine deaminase n=1 Tax=Caulobacter mirabilis TaxID=69666 RepID=A0A2D2B235_9CAUL|nr:nucleoside deaminase [Caulobacter mirabilis]ATQ44311.1 tRNA-specific adenosine deaminase [Caulobacter mirabilis]